MQLALILTEASMKEIHSQALAEHPAECCGLLTSDEGESISRVHPCENIQDRLHAEDSEQYPRDARIAYFIDPQEQFRIISTAERAGGQVSGFYHSHIDCDAYFSDEDKERAMAWDEPAYPDAVYLVVAAYPEGIRGYKAFGWDEMQRNFIEVEVRVLTE